MQGHTVEKIGGTSMSDYEAVRDNIIDLNRPPHALYNRVFVVSAYSGTTNGLLEDQSTNKPGVYALFANDDSDSKWSDRLTEVADEMLARNKKLFPNEHTRRHADQLVNDRIEGIRNCLLDLQRICSCGHFQLEEHLSTVREMLAGLGEANSAFNLALLMQHEGVNARFVDLTGWQETDKLSIDDKIKKELADYDFSKEMLIVTGYAHCKESMLRAYGRGYSEITFSKIAEITEAKEAIIHKEYHLSSADPKVVGDEKVSPIGRTNYDVADQLSLIGMEAIHPKSAKGLRKKNIPLRVKNTFQPDHDGTLITNDYVSDEPCVEIVAGKHNVFALDVFDQDMTGEQVHFLNIQQIAQDCKVSLLAREHNANTVTLYISSGFQGINKLKKRLQDNYVNAEISSRKVAVISVIGSDMNVPGILADVSNALADDNISILAIQQGMRQVDIRVIVSNDSYKDAIRALHRRFFESSKVVCKHKVA
ncbi:aspartate kinase [Aliidiomarina halalkaliphila]|uniref:aspartate kinase n=1 Tax=Aliidiomarina halalkaliphila TaxID=2593535 RepID=A0A552X1G5_9GAMM|nr:aspartate kinase [Aliidiomarina halalkaliphila]TRW48891.1 aspartate kinase [Aliidiomarina halalkaliphila]